MKSRRILYQIAVFWLFCFFSSGRAIAEKEITILSSNYPPHIYVENGEIKGIRLDPSIRPLGLTDSEMEEIVVFLESLTGDNVETMVRDAFAAPIGDRH